jgi:hypothetical protein
MSGAVPFRNCAGFRGKQRDFPPLRYLPRMTIRAGRACASAVSARDSTYFLAVFLRGFFFAGFFAAGFTPGPGW